MRAQRRLTFAEEVRRGLADPVQKSVPAKYLYDDVGSALFEAITHLEEYGLTRADLRLLSGHGAEIAGMCGGVEQIVELGSGTGVKARLLLGAFAGRPIYRPVDLSHAALCRCSAELSGFRVEPVAAEFLPGLEYAARRRESGRLLVAFLGSNIGNFSREEIPLLFAGMAERLARGDLVLIGADLVKPVERLLAAYDDAAGITAAFDRNLLVRINRELGADFRPSMFLHEARWNAEHRRIEMHLRPTRSQTVSIRDLSSVYEFRPDETIWTESSHKFEPGEIPALAAPSGFRHVATWTDVEWPFSEVLLELVS